MVQRHGATLTTGKEVGLVCDWCSVLLCGSLEGTGLPNLAREAQGVCREQPSSYLTLTDALWHLIIRLELGQRQFSLFIYNGVHFKASFI